MGGPTLITKKDRICRLEDELREAHLTLKAQGKNASFSTSSNPSPSRPLPHRPQAPPNPREPPRTKPSPGRPEGPPRHGKAVGTVL